MGFYQGGNFSKITKVLAEDSQAAGNALSAGGDGKIALGTTTLVVWTKHLTHFVLYSQSPIPTGCSGGGGGGAYPAAPGTPNVEVVTVNQDSITLRLSGNDMVSFEVYINEATVPVNLEPIKAVNNQAVYQVTDLNPGTTYIFKVKGRLAEGTLTKFSSVTATTTALPGQPTSSFADVAPTFWAYQEIQAMAEKGYVRGVSQGLFEPNKTITRAEFTAMLVNVLDLTDSDTITFADVTADDWFYSSVAKAHRAGLVKGLAENQFAPNQPITRQQIAALLTNALRYQGVQLEPADAGVVLSNFRDRDQIQPWALYSSAVTVQKRIIGGKPGERFAPQDPTTRAEATVMVKRLLELPN